MTIDRTTLIILICGIAFLGFLIYNSRQSKENFGMLPSFGTNIVASVATSREAARKGDFFSVPGYSAILAPRAASLNYGANIRQNMPAYEHQGIPCDPLTFGNMARSSLSPTASSSSGSKRKETKEDYGCGYSCGNSCSPATCSTDGSCAPYRGGAPLMKADYSDGNYSEVLEETMKGAAYPEPSSMIPVQTMSTIDELGEQRQVVMFDNLMTVNKLSRLQGQGDPIRGDLAIAPQNFGWFNVAAVPSADLKQGALGVITDPENSNTVAMMDLINATSGQTAVAGADLSTMKQSQLGFQLDDLNITAFP